MTHVIIFICLCVCVHLAGRAGLCVCACVCLCDDYPWFVLCLLSMVWNLFNINCLNWVSQPWLELCLIGYPWHVYWYTLLSSYGVLSYGSSMHADDTQAYLHCPSTAAMGVARTMHQAMGALADWMSSNRLRLNAQKTKFIWLPWAPGSSWQSPTLTLSRLNCLLCLSLRWCVV